MPRGTLLSMSDLSQKLAMDHLKKSDADLRTKVEEQREEIDSKKEEAEKPLAVQKSNPMNAREYTFPFSFTNLRGETFSAQFTNHILNLQQKQNVGVLESQFNGGQPYESLEPITQAVNRGLAWMTFSLRGRDRQEPKGWADSLLNQDDEDLILALFSEVSAHESQFHGRSQNQASS